jgi:hypothetical protein
VCVPPLLLLLLVRWQHSLALVRGRMNARLCVVGYIQVGTFCLECVTHKRSLSCQRRRRRRLLSHSSAPKSKSIFRARGRLGCLLLPVPTGLPAAAAAAAAAQRCHTPAARQPHSTAAVTRHVMMAKTMRPTAVRVRVKRMGLIIIKK